MATTRLVLGVDVSSCGYQSAHAADVPTFRCSIERAVSLLRGKGGESGWKSVPSNHLCTTSCTVRASEPWPIRSSKQRTDRPPGTHHVHALLHRHVHLVLYVDLRSLPQQPAQHEFVPRFCGEVNGRVKSLNDARRPTYEGAAEDASKSVLEKYQVT